MSTFCDVPVLGWAEGWQLLKAKKKLTAKCNTLIVVDRDNVLMNKGMARKVKIS